MGNANDFMTAFNMAKEIKKINNNLVEINLNQKELEDDLLIELMKKLGIYDFNHAFRYFICRLKVRKNAKSELVFLRKHIEMPIYEIFTENGVQIIINDLITNELIDQKVRFASNTVYKHTKNRDTIHLIQKIILSFVLLLLAISFFDFVITSFTQYNISIIRVNNLTQLGMIGLLLSGVLGLLDCINEAYKNYLWMSRIFLGRLLVIVAIIDSLFIIPVIFMPREIVTYQNGFIFVSILIVAGSSFLRIKNIK